MRKELVVLLLVACMSSFASPSTPQYPGAVVKILHDDKNVYVAKYDVLVAIDKQSGRQTAIYRKPEDVLPNNGLTAMVLQEGRLWFGTDDGLIMDYYEDCLNSHEYEGMPAECTITGIAFDSQGRMVIGIGNRIGWIDGNRLAGLTEIPSDVTEQNIHTMVMDQMNTLWVTCTGYYPKACFCSYTIEAGVSLTLDNFGQLPFSDRGPARGLAFDRHGNKWFCVSNQLIMFNGEYFEAKELGAGQSWGAGIDVAIGDDGAAWVPMWNGPLTRVSESGESTAFTCELNTNRWYCIDIDGDDIYIGTDSKVLRFKDGVFSEIEIPSSLPGPNAISSGLAPNNSHTFPYDLQGRRVQQPQQPGIYIRDGRKVLKK